MSAIENVNGKIEELITNLVDEYGQTGLFNTPSDERKAQIIKQISQLRASMESETKKK